MSIRYKCIVIDHDDTTINSTQSIHYPSYVDFCEKYMKNKNYKMLTMPEYIRMMWDWDFDEYLRKEMKLNDEEYKIQYESWLSFCEKGNPEMFDGFLEMLKEFRKRGGIIAVCSHSEAKDIKRHYEKYNFYPDEIFGFVLNHPEYCKPNTYPIDTLKEKYHLESKDICVIDDLYPGIEMAKKSGVDPIGVLYAEGHELIIDDMKKICKEVFCSVKDLSNYLFNIKED